MEEIEETQRMCLQVEELLQATPDDAELIQALSDLYDILNKQISQAIAASESEGGKNEKLRQLARDYCEEEFSSEDNDNLDDDKEEEEGSYDVSHIHEGDNFAILFPYWRYGDILLRGVVLHVEAFEILVYIETPITLNTVTCKYFWGPGCEKYSCRLGHGTSVQPNQLLPLEELYDTKLDWVQKEMLAYGKKVIYRSQAENGELWKIGEITDQLDGPDGPQWEVRALEGRSYCVTVGLKDIRPLQCRKSKETEAKESDNESVPEASISEEDEEEDDGDVEPAPKSWGGWETYSTGFASKMMRKMGYLPGQGLGLSGQGRLDPIEAKPYDQGRPKNLKGGTNRPGLGLTHKKEPKKKKAKKDNAEKNVELDMFGFMDTLLGNKETKNEKPSTISSSALPSTSREANRSLAKLQEKIESAQREYNNAEAAVRRNKGKPMEHQFQQKLERIAKSLADLKTEANTINGHVKRKKERESMYTF